MPEPLPDVVPLGLNVDPRGAFRQYPAVGLALGLAIAAYSELESRVGSSLARLMGANAELGIAMYTTVVGALQQSRLVLAAAREILDGEDLALFEVIMSFTRRLADQRNLIAHSIWGYSMELPDAFILFSQKSYARWNAELQAWQHGRGAMPGAREPGNVVYREKDFLDIADRARVVGNYWGAFWIFKEDFPGSPTRKSLLREPEIAALLSR